MRTYDIEDFHDNIFTVKMARSLFPGNNGSIENSKQLEEWCDQNCEDVYLFLMENAIFRNARDACMFRLKFGI